MKYFNFLAILKRQANTFYARDNFSKLSLTTSLDVESPAQNFVLWQKYYTIHPNRIKTLFQIKSNIKQGALGLAQS